MFERLIQAMKEGEKITLSKQEFDTVTTGRSIFRLALNQYHRMGKLILV